MYAHLGNVFDDIGDAIGSGASAAGEVVCDIVQSVPGSIATNAVFQYGIATGDHPATGAGAAAILARELCLWAGHQGPGGTPGTAAAPNIPPGSVGARDPDTGMYLIAVPLAYSHLCPVGLQGLGDPSIPAPLPGADLAQEWNLRLYAPYTWKNKYKAERPYRSVASGGTLRGPKTHCIFGRVTVLPPGVMPVELSQFQDMTGTTPWYKDTMTWVIAGGGVVALLLLSQMMKKKEQ